MKTKIFLLLVLLVALLVRVYRIGDLLGFYYDQGRDAQVIWDLWHNHKFFLIGPTTGIEGIFRGPWYYWLIGVPYLLGRGDPIWPAIFLGLTTLVAVFVCYKLASRLGGTKAGFLALIISGLSFYLMQASRWLSNPTPMFLISMGVVYFMFQIIDGKKWSYLPLGFLLGLAMQFGSATEVFYFPAIIIFLLFNKKLWPDLKTLLLSGFLLLTVFAPQIFFDLRHEGILHKNILNFFVADKSFQASFSDTLKTRLPFYIQVFGSKLFPSGEKPISIFLGLALISLIINFFKSPPHLKFLVLLIFAPLVGMLFFHGNQGNVYDYYFTGYYLVFILLFSVLIAKLGFLPVSLLLLLFLHQNVPLLISYLGSGTDGPTTIAFAAQKQAVNWILADTSGYSYNVDVYVPPVIPYAYDYLFTWMGTLANHLPDSNMQFRLYLLYEQDPPHPERLGAWMTRQAGYASVESSATFGGITVERRLRFNK